MKRVAATMARRRRDRARGPRRAGTTVNAGNDEELSPPRDGEKEARDGTETPAGRTASETKTEEVRRAVAPSPSRRSSHGS